MAMNASTLKTAIKGRLTSTGFNFGSSQCKADEFVDIMCEEIISHITNFAVVSASVTVASVSGVTTGPGVSGPGAGTATGTIS
jgi:hypothetical protein